jgi:hypothetical protein
MGADEWETLTEGHAMRTIAIAPATLACDLVGHNHLAEGGPNIAV